MTKEHDNTVLKTINILEFLSNNPEGANLTDLALSLNYPKSTVFDILKSLISTGMIHYIDSKQKIYGIGSKAYKIGNTYLRATNLYIIAKPYLIEIADKYKKTTFISKREGDKFTFVYKYESPNSLVKTAETGDQKPLHSTAIGKCYLAFDPTASKTIDIIELKPYTKYTITNRNELKEQIEYIRKLGFSFEYRESQLHMSCVAAPIYNNEKSMISTISMSGLYLENEDLKIQGFELKKLAKIISEKIGYIEK